MRHTIAENIIVLGKFDTGATVTISLKKLIDGSTVTLTSSVCSEVGTTGVYKWSSLNITTPPSSFTEYLWIMTDGTVNQYGKIVLGGFPDSIKAKTDNLPADPASEANAATNKNSIIAEVNANETKIDAKPTLAQIEASTVLAKEATLNSIAADLLIVKKIETGRWKIVNNQMIFYDNDGVSPLLMFDLKNAAGQPTEKDAYERLPA